MPEMRNQSVELIRLAANMAPMLRERAERADQERRLEDDTIQAMIRAGIFRIWTPKRYGGYQASIAEHYEMIAELAKGCPATAWTVAMMTTTSWMACQLSEKAQDEIFGEDPDARFVGLFTPTSQPAIRTEGGYIINGSRPFGTGCLHATWAEIMVPVVNDSGQVINSMWTFVPMRDVEIKDTWHTMGLRGTGSHTLSVKDLFVPEHRTIAMMGPQGVMEGFTKNEHRDEEPLYRIPLAMISRECFVGSMVGTAQSALAHVLATLPKRAINYGPHTDQSKAVSTQIQIAEIANMIDTAEMHARRAIADCDAAGAAGTFPSLELRARCGHDSTFAIRTCKEAVDRLMYLCGASSVAKGNPLERMYRDISTGTLHGVARVDATLELLGSALCGQGPAGTFVY
jgi:hypothetical protein